MEVDAGGNAEYTTDAVTVVVVAELAKITVLVSEIVEGSVVVSDVVRSVVEVASLLKDEGTRVALEELNEVEVVET